MNLDKTRAVLITLRDEEDYNDHTFIRTDENRAALTAVIDLLDTSKWGEYAKKLKELLRRYGYYGGPLPDDDIESIKAGAVALTLVPQIEARVKVLTEELRKMVLYSECLINRLTSIEREELNFRDLNSARRALTGAKENEHG